MTLLQAAVRKYRKRSIRRSERKSDFRDRVFPFPEIRRINGEVQFTASGIKANKVHFRYRGYYCDEETGFYYLQSRYYGPSICRFISADQYELVGTSDTVGLLNLYAYCNNNPVMHTDPSGEIVFSTALIIIGAVAGVIAGGYIGYQAVVNNPTLTTSQKLASIGLCAILGGIAGGFFGAGLGYALPAVISGGIGSATEAALVGAVAISPEEAIIMGVAVGGGVAVAVNGFFDPNTMGDNIAYYQRKPAAPRIHCGSRKEAYDKAFQKGGKKKLSYIRRVAGIII